MVCDLCVLPEEYRMLVIKRTKLWTVMLRKNQSYLGWCFVVLNRHAEDLFDVTEIEWQELKMVSTQLRNVLQELFQPDRINYASLGNKTSHVHLQIIPRYKKVRIFLGKTFFDKNWGKNYSPYDDGFELENNILVGIGQNIKDKFIINEMD